MTGNVRVYLRGQDDLKKNARKGLTNRARESILVHK